ncbi:MAG: hypothetical protein OK449_10965, partial [Thaumarchaeota archaeon]|nr:hypothetical protein [Nitrososphaerota archaeon]
MMQSAKGEEILELHQKTTGMTIKDITQTGIVLEMNSSGEAKGRFHAKGFGTVTVTQAMDGSSTWQGKNILTTNDGDMVVGWGNGTGKRTGATSTHWEGSMNFMSQSPKLAWLTGAKVWGEGDADDAKGESHAKFYLQK